jgi:Domain of unknown function (DUF4279)
MNTYTAFLRVRHPSIDPGEITRVLGLEPAHAWAAGSPRGEAAAARGAHAESYWFAPLGESIWSRPGGDDERVRVAGQPWQLASQMLPLETFLLALLRQLAPHQRFFARLHTEGGSCELAVTLSASDRFSIELPAGLLRSLAALDMSITLDVSTGEEPVAH